MATAASQSLKGGVTSGMEVPNEQDMSGRIRRALRECYNKPPASTSLNINIIRKSRNSDKTFLTSDLNLKKIMNYGIGL